MKRTSIWLILIVVLIGCYAAMRQSPFGRLPDAELQFLYEPDKITRLRAQLHGEWFEIPASDITEVLIAFKPTNHISSRSNCELIASIDLERDTGETYQLYAHTSGSGFDVHTRHWEKDTSKQPLIEFTGRDWRKLEEILQEIESKAVAKAANKGPSNAAESSTP